MTIRVLLVDDVADVRRLVRIALRYHGGFDVVGEARAGLEAVELATALQPDIVLLDLGLPDLDGFEVCRRMRSGSEVPIISVCGYSWSRMTPTSPRRWCGDSSVRASR